MPIPRIFIARIFRARCLITDNRTIGIGKLKSSGSAIDIFSRGDGPLVGMPPVDAIAEIIKVVAGRLQVRVIGACQGERVRAAGTRHDQIRDDPLRIARVGIITAAGRDVAVEASGAARRVVGGVVLGVERR